MATLKDQLAVEIRKRQQYISHSVRVNEEIEDECDTVDDSPKKGIHNVKIEPLLYEHESKKLEKMMELHSPSMRHRGQSPAQAARARSGLLRHTPVPLRSSVGK